MSSHFNSFEVQTFWAPNADCNAFCCARLGRVSRWAVYAGRHEVRPDSPWLVRPFIFSCSYSVRHPRILVFLVSWTCARYFKSCNSLLVAVWFVLAACYLVIALAQHCRFKFKELRAALACVGADANASPHAPSLELVQFTRCCVLRCCPCSDGLLAGPALLRRSNMAGVC
jgi:hypothetical protein